MNSVRILVLGDIGRSPRMRNHALSFANSGWEVFLSGYLNSDLSHFNSKNQFIHINGITETSNFIDKRKSNKLFLILKVFLTALYLFIHLLTCEWTHILFIQNPPAVPTFFIAWMICKIRKIKIMIDWHNLGYTLVPGPDENQNYFRRLYKRLELNFSRKRLKAKNFTVSKAFKNELFLKWDIDSDVIYDLPWVIEEQRDLKRIHHLFMKLKKDYLELNSPDLSDNSTVLTKLSNDNDVELQNKRPAILISSCSWTIDDDFETLFHALDNYNALIVDKEEELPNILCIITGKGPLKSYFQGLIDDKKWNHVSVIMPWLEIEDYPVMLSAGDIGVSLHKSSSGLDLPMKIVDMFSVGLPVLALNYMCLHELVTDRVNGRLFSTSESLVKHLTELLPQAVDSKTDNSALLQYRHNICNCSKNGLWQSEWESVVLPVATNIAIDFYNKGSQY